MKIEQTGWYPGSAPLGYLNSRDEKGNKIITIDPKLGPVIYEAFVFASTGKLSINGIIEKLKDRGLTYRKTGRPFGKATVHRLLMSPFYSGMFRWGGKLFVGKHEPIISRELFEQVQDAMKGSKKPHNRASKRDHAFAGLLHCSECGCAVVAEKKVKKSGRTYTYYHCTNARGAHKSQTVVREELLSTEFGAAIKALEFDSESLEYVKHLLIDHHQKEKTFLKENVCQLQQRYNQIQAHIDKAYDDKLMGRIGEDFWQARHSGWRKDQDEIREKLERFERADDKYMELGIQILELAKNAYSLYVKRSAREQRELLDFVLSNPRLNGTTVEYSYQKPFDLIAKEAKRQNWLRRRDSNPRPSG